MVVYLIALFYNVSVSKTNKACLFYPYPSIETTFYFGSSVKCIDWKQNKGLLLTRYDFPESMVLQGEKL